MAPSISEEYASEESQEEYSDSDGFVYHRENASRHGHWDRDAYFPDDVMGDENNNQPSMFRAAAPTSSKARTTSRSLLTRPAHND